MSKFEDRAYRVGKSKPNVAEMKSLLARLKHDLEQFMARKPGGAVVDPLRARIRELQAEINEAEAEVERKRERQPAGDDGDESDRGAGGGAFVRSTSGRFPPRGRPGR
ncbi:MAG TPA: Gas vesicle protein V [Azospirillum sp.]|nr:Gas vesicle protein V [Azospirillum sp.]